MPYATPQDFIDTYGEPEAMDLAADVNGISIDVDLLERYALQASGEMDAYLSRYIPFEQVPQAIKTACLKIMRYLASAKVSPREHVRDDYKDAITFLTKVAKGEIALVVPKVDDSAPVIQPVRYWGDQRQFSGSALRDY